MSINNKLKALELLYEVHKEKFPKMPDFNSYTEEQHIQYVEKWKKDFVFKHRLNSFEEAESLLKKWLSKDLISEEHYNAFIMTLKDFWDEH